MHPAQYSALLAAWDAREVRAMRRAASLEFIVALSNGVTINGRKPRLDDFLPESAKPKKRKASEADLKAMLMAMARAKPTTQKS